jgi:uncharacterized phage-associated protein
MGKLILLRRSDGTMSRKVSVFDVAQYFLSLEETTHKKLQKLCYYAQAWHLALLNKPLFDNSFEAWIHGPVCPELYHQYKDFGWCLIPKTSSVPSNIAEESIEILDAVYDAYGKLSGDDLEFLTHSEKPWIEARKGLNEWEPSHNIIKEDTMAKYYKEKYEASQSD